MEDAQESAVVEQVHVKHDALDERMRALILAQHPELYPDEIYVGVDKNDESWSPIPGQDLFGLRAKDGKSDVLPDPLSRGSHVRTIVIGDDMYAGEHMDTSFELAKERDKIKHEGGGKDKQKALPQGQGKGKQTAAVEPEEHECVKAFFYTDSQTPNIELIASDESNGNTISCRIFAQDISWDDEDPSRTAFKAEKYQPDTTVNREKPSDEHEHGAKRLIEKMSQSFEKTCVIRVSITLRGEVEQRRWEGISESDLAAIRANPNKSLVRDSLITLLDGNKHIELYFTCKSATGYIKRWEDKFTSYMRDLLTVAKYYGNFWFYNWQCREAGLESTAFREPELPNIDWVVPRWLVTEWTFTKTTTSARFVELSNPRPYLWAPLDFPESGYQDPNEAAFLLKMGVQEERKRQQRDLKERVQSNGTKWFRGRFRSLDKKKRTYAVEVFLGLEAEMAKSNLTMPRPGTRIHLEVDRINAAKPQKQNTAKLDGVVVYDALESEASFICVVNVSGQGLHMADNETEYHTFISYIVDDIPHQRMMDGIALLQCSVDKELGPDFRRTIFDYRVPAKNTDILKRETEKKDIDKFKAAVKEISPLSNENQMRGAVQTCVSPSGNVVLVGPPGTGKTDTIQKIGHAQATLGRRVMFTAPMNSNVHTLVDEFIKNNAALPAAKRYKDHEWVYFTGGYTKMSKADVLRNEQLAGDEALVKANEKMFGYLHDAQRRAHIPRYEQTLGYKLRQRIDVWASDPSFDQEPHDRLHTRAKSYLETQLNLPYLSDKEEKSRAKSHLRALEYNFSLLFLEKVKFCFCTLSTSGHKLLSESGTWDVLIIDEAARDTRAGIAVALGSLRGRVKLVVWAGDHNQGEGVVVGADSNVGFNLLSRNVFASLATVTKKGKATPCEVTLLDVCYRMEQRLIRWSSKWCYDGKVTSSPGAGSSDMALRKMLKLYWSQRLSDDYKGQYKQIGLDVTDIGIKDEFMTGTTTRLNRGEAKMIARTVVDMLIMDRPKDDKNGLRRIRGEDICIIANYTGQVLEIQRQMHRRANEVNVKKEDLDALWYRTTADVHGKERPITFYSTTIAPGVKRLAMKDHLPIGFVADKKNLNVSITRCKVARYTVGALQLFVQARKDGHPVSRHRRHLGFFDFVGNLHESGSIISFSDSKRWFTKREKPLAPSR